MNKITVYHHNKLSKKYEKTVYENISVHGSDTITVRIFTDEPIKISPEDYILRGVTSEENPPKDKSYKITAVYENLRGTRPHYKIKGEFI